MQIVNVTGRAHLKPKLSGTQNLRVPPMLMVGRMGIQARAGRTYPRSENPLENLGRIQKMIFFLKKYTLDKIKVGDTPDKTSRRSWNIRICNKMDSKTWGGGMSTTIKLPRDDFTQRGPKTHTSWTPKTATPLTPPQLQLQPKDPPTRGGHKHLIPSQQP